MSDVTIRVPQDIVQALRLPPDVVAVELQRERGSWHSTSGVSSLPGRQLLLQVWTDGSGRNCSGHEKSPGITPMRISTWTIAYADRGQ